MFRSNVVRAAIRAAFVCCALAPLATIASAQLKVGVINSQKAMLDSEEMKKASAELEAKYKPKQDQLLKLQNDLQSIEQQISSGKLNQQAGAELQAQGTRKQRDAQRLSDDTQQEFDRDRQEVLAKAATKLQDVIRKVAEDRGLDLVVDVSQTLYFKPAMDLTADATAAYNKANPAK
jgi:outer membrane protein